jgi:N-acyl-D-amino-acid deacylase
MLLLFLPILGKGQHYDLLIVNGRIIDGTGNPWFYGDIGVREGKIVKIGKIKGEATQVIDAHGMIVSPGFIDVHTHIETNDFKNPTADNFIQDGVTTVITGNCGVSNVDLEKYFFKLDSARLSINVASLIGHNSVRKAIMGEDMRDPSPEEQQQMEHLVKSAMEAGAVGFSTGLIYVPGTYAKTPEIVGLAKVAATYNGVYASHIRDEGDHVLEAIDEALLIGREAKIPVEISHFKVTYKPNWGMSEKTLARIERARLDGIDVTIDQYPYSASSTTLNTVVPTWVFSGGNDSLMRRLNTPAIREKIKQEMAATLKKKKLKNYAYAVVANYEVDSTYNGKNISEINRIKGRRPTAMNEAETILEMIVHGRVQMVFFSMDEKDLKRILQYPFNMIASDAGIAVPGPTRPHPRGYGTNARVLGKYVRDEKIITLEEAIRRMTSLPARKFKLRDRGILQDGMAADIVVFDEKAIADLATYASPHRYSAGFNYVIVNGVPVLEHGKHNGIKKGTVLRGPEAKENLSIVFVCEHGAARSLIAAKYFERVSKQNGFNANIIFRGISPDSVLHKGSKAGLIQDGLAVGKDEKPKALSEDDVKRAKWIITIDCALPPMFDRYNDKLKSYEGVPSIDKDYGIARDSIIRITEDVLWKLKRIE